MRESLLITSLSLKLGTGTGAGSGLHGKLLCIHCLQERLRPGSVESCGSRLQALAFLGSRSFIPFCLVLYLEEKAEPPQAMNALMRLNQLKPGLQYKLISQTGPVHAPIFTMAVEVDGSTFEASGPSKKTAKLHVAVKVSTGRYSFQNRKRTFHVGLSLQADCVHLRKGVETQRWLDFLIL